MPSPVPEPVAELVSAFAYNPVSGEIRTKQRVLSPTHVVPEGIDPVTRRAGRNEKEFPVVQINGRGVHAARVAFAHVLGSDPESLTYPRDGDPFNLRWENWAPRPAPGRPKGSSDSTSRKALLGRISALQEQVRALQDQTIQPMPPETAPAAPQSAPESPPLPPHYREAATHAAVTLESISGFLVQLRGFYRADTAAAEAAATSAASRLREVINSSTEN